MSNQSLPGAQGVMRELDAYREPANGDYVAYLEMIERRQIAQLGRPQMMAAAAAAATPRHGGKAPANPASAKELAVLMSRIDEAKDKVGKFGVGQLVAAVIGVVLLLVTLVGEGSFVTLAIGLGLLWEPIRRLRRLWREMSPTPNRAVIDTTFGKPNPPK